MTLTQGADRENHVVEFDEGRLIAWRPSEPGARRRATCGAGSSSPSTTPPPSSPTPTTGPTLTDPTRLERARATTADKLQASIDRLAALAERS